MCVECGSLYRIAEILRLEGRIVLPAEGAGIVEVIAGATPPQAKRKVHSIYNSWKRGVWEEYI
jgi:hypothetical protein